MKECHRCGTTAGALAAFAAFTVLLPSISAAEPSASIYTDVASCDPCDQIEVGLSAHNNKTETIVDVYIGVIMPADMVLTYNTLGFSASIQPWLCNVRIPVQFTMSETLKTAVRAAGSGWGLSPYAWPRRCRWLRRWVCFFPGCPSLCWSNRRRTRGQPRQA